MPTRYCNAGQAEARFLAGAVAVFDTRETFDVNDIMINTAAKGAAMATVLADTPVELLSATGLVAVGP